MIRFFFKPVPTGKVENGVPLFRNVLMIEVTRSATSKVVLVAKDRHIEAHRAAYERFMRDAEDRASIEGFPLVAAPFATPADIAMCEAARIFTVEAVVERGTAADAPEAIRDLAERADAFLSTLAGSDTDRAAEIDALNAKVATLEEALTDANAEAKALKAAAAKAAKAA